LIIATGVLVTQVSKHQNKRLAALNLG